MQAEEIGLLLKQDRGQFLEFISAYEYRRSLGQKKREEELAREIVRVLSGMANADGGDCAGRRRAGQERHRYTLRRKKSCTQLIQAPQNLLRPQLNPSCEKFASGICSC